MTRGSAASGRKGIIAAAGLGTRLYPVTRATNKELLPVYDKPMIYYPLSVLLWSGIRDILLVAAPDGLPRFRNLLGDGSRWGIRISYAVQRRPEGVAQALIIGKEFIGHDHVCLILGDNMFHGTDLQRLLERAANPGPGSIVFVQRVRNPEQYGVVQFDKAGKACGIEEKPSQPKSKYAVTGLYYFDSGVTDIAAALKPSRRGELEMADVIKAYLKRGQLRVEILGRKISWMDMGTPTSLLDAGRDVERIQRRQRMMLACIEEVAFRMGFIGRRQLARLAARMPENSYGEYVRQLSVALQYGEAIDPHGITNL